MDLVGLVVAGQHIHHDIDAGTVGIFALRFIGRHGWQYRYAVVVDRPGAGEIIAGDQDRRNAIGRRGRFSLGP